MPEFRQQSGNLTGVGHAAVSHHTAERLFESFPHQLTPADWAARQPEFEKSFKMLKPKEWHDAMIALSDYLVLPDDQREGREPYIPYVDQKRIFNGSLFQLRSLNW